MRCSYIKLICKWMLLSVRCLYSLRLRLIQDRCGSSLKFLPGIVPIPLPQQLFLENHVLLEYSKLQVQFLLLLVKQDQMRLSTQRVLKQPEYQDLQRTYAPLLLRSSSLLIPFHN
ncbi:HAMP domain-containing protein [Sesbania bispinosa]|nr:HAMP domain-containing protein [Sesbania bispinosa]